jgi:hypothetical protein
MTLSEFIWGAFGPGGAIFGITLIILFTFLYCIANLIIIVKGKYRYRKQANLYYKTTCFISFFGYLAYYMYVSAVSPVFHMLFG